MWDLGTTEGADGVAVVEVFVETCDPFTSHYGITKSSSKAGGAQLGKWRKREKFSYELTVIISALVKRAMKKFISKIRIDQWIQAMNIKT